MYRLQDISIRDITAAAIIIALGTAWLLHKKRKKTAVPISVNYHFTRQCNRECGFCFHTAKTSHVESEENAKKALALLKRAGMKKVNFAGGEPFLNQKFLGRLVKYCKEVLRLEGVSIVSNGSLITEAWFQQYGQHLDILAVSCDSFNEDTNIAIGRGTGDNVQQLRRISKWCEKHGVQFKLNTVVCKLNFTEDMSKKVAELAPFRWKVFQVLMVEGENNSEKTLRDVRKYQITDEEFEVFCAKHKELECFVPESNKMMASSYILLDEVYYNGGSCLDLSLTCFAVPSLRGWKQQAEDVSIYPGSRRRAGSQGDLLGREELR